MPGGETIMKLQQVSRLRAIAATVAMVLAGCQTAPMGGDEVARVNRSIPNRSTGLSPEMAAAAARAQDGTRDSARIYKGTGVVVKGMQPGGKLPTGPAV